ncbi:MFS transporter [Cryptosporangium arvum]|uniref:Arabinose efflux permease family protein n=1 Tax=Cryptosporangium arvum DSM 44712 TaxID=927661 RepID=A0A010YKA4_9ACTN|nr:MFS transporter [Cryptosporangium arvum]EXG80665.1 arabinose efflux permease family protein [Cryptosporangium arvum DSM 44712]
MRTRHHLGFWLIAGAFLTAMAFSTVPTPLYVLYQRRDGFSSFVVTVVFATYAVGVVISLLLAGHISDRVGRKRVLLPALGLELLAALIFLSSAGLPELLLARFVSGLGVGMIAATATAYLSELHALSRPGDGTGRFEMVSTAANIGGLGVGPLVAGALAQYLPAPLHTPYLLFAVLLVLAIIGVGFTKETVDLSSERPAWRPQRIGITGTDRRAYLAAAVTAFTAFAVFGLFNSLAPGFVAGTLHHPSRLLAGVVVFVVFGAAATAQTLTSGLRPAARFGLGVSVEALGLLVLVAGMATGNLAGFLVGGALAGAGSGVVFKSAIGAVISSAAPAARGEALAGLFLIGYLGLIVPSLALGVTTRFVDATTAMYWFTGALLFLLATGAWLHGAESPRRLVTTSGSVLGK